MKHFTSIQDVDNLSSLLEEAKQLKHNPFLYETFGKHATIGLIFFNPSLRTRLSSQKAARNLGMEPIVMNINEDSWKIETEYGVIMDGDKSEHIKEAAGVIGRYCDIIGIRSFARFEDREKEYKEPIIQNFIKYSGVPVISLEGATAHPLQAFADLITMEMYKQTEKPKVVLSWAPHPKPLPQAVSNSFVRWMKAAGYDLVITHPEGYELCEEFTEGIPIEYDQKAAFKDADFIYPKSWASYSQYGKVLTQNRSWTVDAEKMELTNNAKLLHCLPVRRNMVVSDEVLDGPNSLVLEEAENRVVSAQTVMKQLLTPNQTDSGELIV